MLRGVLAVAAAFLLLLLSSSPSVPADAGYSLHFGGVICVDESCDPPDPPLDIVAKIGDVDCGHATSFARRSWATLQMVGAYGIKVASAADVSGCGTPDARVDFYIHGRKANQWYNWPSSGYDDEPISVGDYQHLGVTIFHGDDPFLWNCDEGCNGPLVQAFVGNKECGRLQTVNENYNDYFRWLVIAGAHAKPGCAEIGDRIHFTVNGLPAHEQSSSSPWFEDINLSTGQRGFFVAGRVCINSDCSPNIVGHTVVAKIGNTVCDQRNIELLRRIWEPAYSWYNLLVAADEKTPGCGIEGATINFYIDGWKAQQATWTEGGSTDLDLWVGPDISAYSGLSFCHGNPCHNATVQAYIGDALCGEVTTVDSQTLAGAYGPFAVKSAEAQFGCGTRGATVSFKVNGEDVGQFPLWQPGFHSLDLSAGYVLWGDTNCSGRLDAADAMRILRWVLTGESDNMCFAVTKTMYLGPFYPGVPWADINCDLAITGTDALITLLAAGGTPVQQARVCPYLGEPLQVYPLPDH